MTARTRRTAPNGRFAKLKLHVAGGLDRKWGWHRLPLVVSIPTLIGLREILRRENVIDPAGAEVDWGPETPVVPRTYCRSTDGRNTDPNHPDMGMVESILGRNVPIAATGRDDAEFLKPDPRVISDRLLARRDSGFMPATSLNMLAAAWVQFEVHDWISHGDNPEPDPWVLPNAEEGPFPQPQEMTVHRTQHQDGDDPTTYRNAQTHWWDASQVYGSTPDLASRLRAFHGGHLRLSKDGYYPFDPPNESKGPGELKPAENSWWAGLEMFHILFAKEHNAICDHLAETYREKAHDDDWLYHKARLINAALIAKIHTLEWTPALIANPRTELALRVNWWGFQGKHLHRKFGRLTRSPTLSGIPGSDLSYHSVPYALTEEFLSVYRMHPLIPDEVDIRSHCGDHRVSRSKTFKDLAGTKTYGVLRDVGLDDLFYSFATSHPGQLVLHNYPQHLRQLETPNHGTLDLATIDILRDRERGVPRYNDFRRFVRLRPATHFEDFSDDPEVVDELRAIYGNPELVDLMVGLYAEKKPDGFAFSDTAFRVFILMASRRLNSDRFFTYDYNAKTYTTEGLRWIERNTLASVITRHHRALAPALEGVRNPFKPWDSPDNRSFGRWRTKQRFWNGLTRFKFLAAEPLHVEKPAAGERICEIPFTDLYPDIPIDGLVVADHFPKNELDPMVLKVIQAEEHLARWIPPAAGGLASIPANPHAALDAAYTPAYRERYRRPVRPPGYDEELDLGFLAVASPFAYLLESTGGNLRWDLSGLDNGFELHAGLRAPWATVEFRIRDGSDRLEATAIDSELGRVCPGDTTWRAAQRLAMCAASTHITLVRHFNWIHLVAGERFALATNRMPSDHPIRRLLAPHVYATHFGNRIVTPLQLAPGGDFERLFSYTHAGLCSFFEETAVQFNVRSMNPHHDTADRGITDLGFQPALENRQALVGVIRRHVERYLCLSYGTGDEVLGDAGLARWIDELARLPGVRELAGEPITREGLIDLLATLIYMVSVEHEIVDSAVWDYLLWSDVSAPRVYRDGRRMPLDVYQRLVNANFILNVDRTRLMEDFSYLAVECGGKQAFTTFSRDLHELQRTMDREEVSPWRIEPRSLKANINY